MGSAYILNNTTAYHSIKSMDLFVFLPDPVMPSIW